MLRCYVCKATTTLIRHGTDLALCQSCTDKADTILTNSLPAGAPYHSELIAEAVEAAQEITG